jgi:hypothetical protein
MMYDDLPIKMVIFDSYSGSVEGCRPGAIRIDIMMEF